jgi:hypothetical protein
MTEPLYTGPAHPGQNNMTARGCLHASVTHGSTLSKTIAVFLLNTMAGAKTTPQEVAQAEAMPQPTVALEQAQLAWVYHVLKA